MAPRDHTRPAGFAEPGAGHRPGVRWWWPGGAVSTAGIRRELRAIRDAGFSRAEIALLPMGLPDAVAVDDVRTWGTSRFTDRLRDALVAARELGIRIDLTISPGWPLASPAVTGENAILAQQQLVQGHRKIGPGEAVDAVPAPENGATDDDRLVAVTAVRLLETPGAADGPVMLDETSAIDLTHLLGAGTLRWEAPSPGTWMVFSFWSRPSGQRALAIAVPREAPVIDHFSAEAVAATLQHIDQYVLPKDLDPLLTAVGGDIFEDSLEIAAESELWTPAFLTEFQRRRGYDLTPYLPVVRVADLFRFDWATLRAGITPDSPSVHDFDRGFGRRIRHDYYRTLNELYVENHITPLTRWANSRGLAYRAQPYGNIVDHGEAAAAVQTPESEDLVNWLAAGGMTDGLAAYDLAVDFHRGIAASAHMRGTSIVSLECCAILEADYQTDLATLKRHVDAAFCGGINQLMLHGFPYQDVAGATWPGWAPFSNNASPEVSDAWGPRQPMWRHIRSFTDYVARAAVVLRHGAPRIDVAVYKQDYWCLSWPKITATDLGDAGYTYEFLGPSLLALDAPVVRDRRLAPDRAAYRALVIDREPAMEPAVLDRIVTMAEHGLPVVVVGPPPSRAPSFGAVQDSDQAVARLAARLLALPNVRTVDEQKHLPEALDALGVEPDARLHGAVRVLPVHRQGADGDDYYYLFNMGTATSRFVVDLRGSGTARLLDLWNGTTQPVASTVDGDRHTLALTLGPGGTAVVHLGTGPGLAARPVRTEATSEPAQVVWSQNLNRWDIDVADWRPTGTVQHRQSVSAPADWRTIPALADAAGVGTYRTTVVLPAGWDTGVGAVLLDLGQVAGTMRVSVNGRSAGDDCVATRALDVCPLLRDGANHVEIEIATTLGNRLIGLGKAGEEAYARFAKRSPRPAGLIGPVSLSGIAATT